MTDANRDRGQDMFRLVYASRAVLPVLAKFDATVADILSRAQANNTRMGLTGLLIAHRGWFIQCLEGPRRNVSMIFGAIGRDLRHAQLELMQAGPVEDRLFGRWSMCAHAITPDAKPILDMLDLSPGLRSVHDAGGQGAAADGRGVPVRALGQAQKGRLSPHSKTPGRGAGRSPDSDVRRLRPP